MTISNQFSIQSFDSTFSNRKRAIPTSPPSKRSKGEIAMVVDHLPQFTATQMQDVHIAL